uniref:G-patch domain and KOW motifs-containing protein n=1 Tax=Anas zonorhyncha TaxID=75864 RepID=A0A8B9V6V4_9AVES
MAASSGTEASGAATTTGPVSFGFSRKAERRRVLADYEAVPVAAFGLAMLRGMGWSQGEGIGRTFKRVVKPLEHRLRPRGLGLGAEPAPPGPPKSGQPPRGGDEPGGGGGLAVGADVRIEAGPHRDMYGKVEGLDLETARAVVRLALGGQVVTVSQHNLRPGTPPATGEPPSPSQYIPVTSHSPPVLPSILPVLPSSLPVHPSNHLGSPSSILLPHSNTQSLPVAPNCPDLLPLGSSEPPSSPPVPPSSLPVHPSNHLGSPSSILLPHSNTQSLPVAPNCPDLLPLGSSEPPSSPPVPPSRSLPSPSNPQ